MDREYIPNFKIKGLCKILKLFETSTAMARVLTNLLGEGNQDSVRKAIRLLDEHHLVIKKTEKIL